MSDTGGPGTGGGLPDKVESWAQRVFKVLEWGFQAMGPMGLNTPADDMEERLSPVRPVGLTAPPGASPDEAKAIDDGYANLLAMVRGLIDRDDLTEPLAEERRVAQLVVDARNRIVADAQARAKRATDLKGRLAALAVPPGATAEEAKGLTDEAARIAAALPDPATAGALDTAEAAEAGLGRAVNKVAEAVETRRQAAEARAKRAVELKTRLKQIVAPPGATANELKSLADRVAGISLPEPLTDGALDKADADATKLESDAAALMLAVEARAKRAEAVRARLQKVAAPPGVTGEEARSIADRVAGVSLPDPLTDGALDKAEADATKLESDAAALKLAVEARAKRAADLIQRAEAVAAPVGATAEEAKALTDRAAQIEAALPDPLTEAAVKKGETDAADLVARGQALAKTVADRQVKGKALVKDLTDAKGKLPAGANDTEKAELEKLCNDAIAGLLAPFVPDALNAGDKAKGEATAKLQAIGKAVTDRVARRKGLTDRLAKVPTPLAPAEEMRALAKRRADLVKAIADATDTATLDAAEKDVAAVEKEFPEISLLHAALAKGRAALVVAKAEQQAALPRVEQGFNVWLMGQMAAAEKAIGTAKDPAAVTAAEKVMKDALAKVPAAEAFSAKLTAWRGQTDFFLAVGADPTKLAELTKARDDQAKLALQAAEKADFTAAEKALADFATKAGVDAKAMAEADAWKKKLEAFHAAVDDGIGLMGRTKIDGGDSYAKKYKAVLDKVPQATAKATKDHDYTAAGAALDLVEAEVKVVISCMELMKKFGGLNLKARDPADLNRVAYEGAIADLNANKPADALAKLQTIDGSTDGTLAEAQRRLNLLQGKVGEQFKDGAEKGKPWIKGLLDQAKAKLDEDPPETVTANLRLGEAEKRLTAARDWVPAMRAAMARRKALDSTNAFKILDGAETDIVAGKPADSLAKINAAAPALDMLEAYQDLKPQADKLLKSLTNGTPAHKLVDDALKEAVKEYGKKDAVKAVAILRALIANPAVDALAADAALWMKRSAEADKRTKAVIAFFGLAEAEKALNDSLNGATKLGDTDSKPSEGLVALDAHNKLLADAKRCAAVYQRMLSVQKALAAAAAGFKDPADKALVYEGTSPANITKDVDAAIALARKAQFPAAAAAFQAVLQACDKAIRNTAAVYEKLDSVDSNAGHSMARHGPDVTPDQLVTRLTTGLAPDGKTSFCPASSKFETPEAWLAARQKAIDKAAMNMSQTSQPVATAKLKVEVIVDHGGPIDMAFDGIKKVLGVSSEGDLKETGAYETFQKMTGITKSYTMFLFELDSPDANTKRPNTVAEFVSRYNAVHLADPADVTGRWVMMQSFPLVAGWDEEKQDYVAS